MTKFLLASEADLFLLGEDVNAHQSSVVIHLVLSISVGLTGVVIAALLGGIHNFVLMCIVSMLGAYGLGTRPQRLVRRKAEKLRRQIELATAVFLDLVNVLLAGGAGIETSVVAAASAGDGPGFSTIRLAVMRAQSARLSYWDSLAEVGRITEVPTLVEVAHTVQLAGQHGARVRSSLSAKAVALRKRNLALVEHDEEQRTEKIGLPLVLLFIGFLLLVGYPAFARTLASF